MQNLPHGRPGEKEAISDDGTHRVLGPPGRQGQERRREIDPEEDGHHPADAIGIAAVRGVVVKVRRVTVRRQEQEGGGRAVGQVVQNVGTVVL